MTTIDPDIVSSAGDLRSALGQLIRRIRREHRVPATHGSVLGALDRLGPQTTSALAAAHHMRPQSMAQTVGDLEATGAVSRRADPADKRQILIELTEQGRAQLVADRSQRVSWLAAAMAQELTAPERELLARAVPLIERLAEFEYD